MGDVIRIHSRRIFSEEEARSLLPVVKRLTERASGRMQEIKDRMRFVPENEPLYKRLKSELDLTVSRWQIKIQQLGCEPRGIWLVDFDAGSGSLTWRLGDEDLSSFNSYEGAPPIKAPYHPDKIPS